MHMSLFKPIPQSPSEAERAKTEHSITSWVAQLNERCELLLGCHQTEETLWQQYRERIQNQYPNAQIKIIAHPSPLDATANPKIAWMQKLIPHAIGELWFWCDADMHAPEGTIESLFSDYEQTQACMVTSPYTITEASGAAAILDTLFVNIEFFPGVLLLERGDNIRFGFGSGMLFRAQDFRAKVDMAFLGRSLADDFHLGRLLQPVKLASTCLSTTVAARDWPGAFSHYRRWQKTVRWNRPGGYASQLAILPLLGWLVAVCLMPLQLSFWLGLAVTIFVDWMFAMLICSALHCRLSRSARLAIPVWSVLRALVFVSCWLPIPVKWRGQIWHSPFADEKS